MSIRVLELEIRNYKNMFHNKLTGIGPDDGDNIISFFAGNMLDTESNIDESELKEDLPILPCAILLYFRGVVCLSL